MGKPVIKINAQQVVNDIRDGLDDETLMGKYRLTNRQLQSLYRKMIKAGYMSALELAHRLCITESQVTDALDLVECRKFNEPE